LLPPFLAETLIGNLISNAVKHNLKGGSIQIQLDKSSLNICNSSTQPEVPPIEFLARFRRGDSQSEGLGLGLAIVKEICDQQGWTLEVKFENGNWTSIVHFHSI
jgi:signal transduction histidine kinase